MQIPEFSIQYSSMRKIAKHPILDIPECENQSFIFKGSTVSIGKGFTVAAALHQAGFPVHSHSLENRERSLECGIGKCGACEMLVDGQIKRICMTSVDNVSEVAEIPKNYRPVGVHKLQHERVHIHRTTVAIIGAGPAGLATREILNQHGVSNIVIDNNPQIGGQFLMQTHQFFFFEKDRKYGGMRGFDIAKTLAGENQEGIFLNSTVWEILEGGRLAVKNIQTDEIYYIDAEHLVVATGAVPFMPTFENDDLPGVYTAAVIQKMMNMELTLLGNNILTVGAGNIGYLTSYQLIQAGANVRAIIEAQGMEGGFPVQANRVRRLGIPIMTSKILTKAVPNADHTGITGAVIADCVQFQPIPGTEQLIEGIDAINICTGLIPDDQLLIKGNEVFGRFCHGVGDAVRIGEGTSAVLRGKQAAYEILDSLKFRFNYDHYLTTAKAYIDSQQHPMKVIEEAYTPSDDRMNAKPFVLIDCLHGFACNPCAFSCPHGAITKESTSSVPNIDFEKCIGCMDCVYQCPGLAIFGYNLKKDWLFLPIEYEVEKGMDVFLVDNQGKKIGNGRIEKIMKKSNKTNIARVKALDIHGEELTQTRGFIVADRFPKPIQIKDFSGDLDSKTYVCHCCDVQVDDVLDIMGERKFISVDEIKHTSRLGMGVCRGKRCIPRIKQGIGKSGKQIIGEATPRGTLSNQITMGDLYPNKFQEIIISSKPPKVIKLKALIAGGGIAGSALFRYLAQEGANPTMINYGRGSSWRNIAGGRPNFSLPELATIAGQNRRIFQELQEISNIDFHDSDYVTFAHNESMLQALEQSMSWSDAELIESSDFSKMISPCFNKKLTTYRAALRTRNCWQATPGKVIDLLRNLGIQHGGVVKEDTQLLDVRREGDYTVALVQNHDKEVIEYHAEIFINALGQNANLFAKKLGIETRIYPVKHQAFITRRLPYMGMNNTPLPMLIDRRKYKGFSAVYGQQLAETGQIIGCASPTVEPLETRQNERINSRDFFEIVSEVFVDWLPELSSIGFQAVWAGYYVEPRMIIDPAQGLFIGLRGQGYMLGQYLAKLYVDALMGKPVPDYFNRLSLTGDGLLEKAFK